jgi:hypothetical protein
VARDLAGADLVENLSPQEWKYAHLRDRLENELHRRVRAGEMTLDFAQALPCRTMGIARTCSTPRRPINPSWNRACPPRSPYHQFTVKPFQVLNCASSRPL